MTEKEISKAFDKWWKENYKGKPGKLAARKAWITNDTVAYNRGWQDGWDTCVGKTIRESPVNSPIIKNKL